MAQYVLELKGITKEFGGVKALEDVSFQLKEGEVHALMGENGAGKSTFIKIITGVYSPDKGEMFVNGQKVNFKSSKDAEEFGGIAAVYQQITGYPHLSVTENIFMGHEKLSKYAKRILWNQMHDEAEKLLRELGANFSPKVLMGSLSVAQQQIVEIAKALSKNTKIMIMDEPTAALTKRESEELYKIIEQLKERGVSIIFVSHRMEDTYRLANIVTVLRDGNYIGTWDVDKISEENLITAMVGRKITQLFPKKNSQIGEELLRVEGLSKVGYFKDISLTLHKGEILGLTGLVGAGRSEVAQAVAGIIPFDKGKIYLEGKSVEIKNPWDAIELGIGYLPEDREEGLILQWEISKNISLPTLKNFTKKVWLIKGWLNEEREIEIAEKLIKRIDVKARSILDLVYTLSGGNQQKVIVAKLLNADLKVIIADEPTKGIDVGAKASIYEIINDLACQGYGIIMISSEMPEILGMSDRIIVMRKGQITRVLDRKEATQELILEAAMESNNKHRVAI